MALVLREAELNRREAALRRAEEARAQDDEGSHARASSTLEANLEARLAEVERRERELHMAVEAVESQRERLVETRREYEARRDALGERSREVEAERDRLRDEQAQLVCASLALEDRERPAKVEVHEAAPPASAPAVPAVEREAAPTPTAAPSHAKALEEHARAMRAATVPEDTGWWTKQLGSPLEAA